LYNVPRTIEHQHSDGFVSIVKVLRSIFFILLAKGDCRYEEQSREHCDCRKAAQATTLLHICAGQKATLQDDQRMSALPSKADIAEAREHDR
jgi:hypothetical protein